MEHRTIDMKLPFLAATVLCFMLSACYYDKGDKLYPVAAQCDTANVTYSGTVKPIITANCLNKACHTSGNPSGGFNFENHSSFIVVIPGDRLLRAINHTAGGSKNMPPTGKMDDCSIKKIEAWIKRGYPNN
jgi:hypothetical protein